MRILSFILLAFIILSCKRNSAESYIDWVESENGFSRNLETENFKIKLQYCPPNYLSLTNHSEIASDSIYFFRMKLEPKELLTSNGFSFNQAYFAFDMPKDIAVKEDGRCCKVDFWHMENTYSITSGRNFLIAIKRANINYKNKIILNIESEIINKEIINFTFDLSREPTVQL